MCCTAAIVINTPIAFHRGGRAIVTYLLGKECFHIGVCKWWEAQFAFMLEFFRLHLLYTAAISYDSVNYIWWCWRIHARKQAKVVKEGPWGANAGNAFDTGRVDRFTKVKIYHGDVIYGLELTFVVGGKPQPPMLIGTKKRASQEVYIFY